MNNLSQVNSNGLGQSGRFSNSSMSSTEIAVNSYESLEAGLTIKTREGDVVTLSTSQFSEMDAYEYSSQGELSSENGQIQATYNLREITLSSGEAFSFSVQGDLSEEELADIESIVAGVDEIIGEMAEGDMEDAIAKALSLGSYDSISRYEADITIERSYEMYAAARTASQTRGRALGHHSVPALAPVQEPALEKSLYPGMSFLDRVTDLLEAQKEESLARARQPLSQLFDHYLNELDEPEAAEDTEEIEEDTGYGALEFAAREIDQMIHDMVKDIFENTLDRMV
jgi:hypothetical protein